MRKPYAFTAKARPWVFPPGQRMIPERYKPIGQAVSSRRHGTIFVCAGGHRGRDETDVGDGLPRRGTDDEPGAGEEGADFQDLQRELDERGVVMMAQGHGTALEEAPWAYKDVENVVDVCHNAGIARKVARLRPIGVVKRLIGHAAKIPVNIPVMRRPTQRMELRRLNSTTASWWGVASGAIWAPTRRWSSATATRYTGSRSACCGTSRMLPIFARKRLCAGGKPSVVFARTRRFTRELSDHHQSRHRFHASPRPGPMFRRGRRPNRTGRERADTAVRKPVAVGRGATEGTARAD